MEKEGIFTILGAIAAIVAAFIAFQQGCLHYPSPQPATLVQTEAPKPPAPQPLTPAEGVAPEIPQRRQAQDQETAARDSVEPRISTDHQEFRPLEFSLSNGEQTVLLSGQAAVGVEFNRVGEMDFVTVRINSETHAALSTGARFDLTVGGQEYYVTMLNVDQEARRVKLRIDRKE